MEVNQIKKLTSVFFVGLGLFWMGLSLLIFEVGPSFVSKMVAWLGAFMAFWAWYRVKWSKYISKRQFRFLLMFLVTLVIMIIGYASFNYMAYVYNGRLDVTKFRQHSLVPQTVKIIRNLDREIQITAFYVGLPPIYLSDMFEEYERNSNGTIKAEIIDPIVQIGYAAQFGQVIDGKQRKVILRTAGAQREIDFTEKPVNQEQINHEILQLTRAARTACFLTGHRERRVFDEEAQGLNTFAKHLLANNIVPQDIRLDTSEQIPDFCDVLVVAGPEDFLTLDEEKQINDYLKVGGDALFLIEHVLVSTPNVPLTEMQMEKNPSLNNILRNWGLAVSKDVVVDLKSHASGDVGSPATRNYLSHRAIVNDLDYTFFVRPRSIKALRDKPDTVMVAPLIMTATEQDSWGETNRYLDVRFNPGEDRRGPVPIGYAAMEPKAEGDQSNTRVIVITDADFISNAYVDAYSNARLGVNAINWLTEHDYETYLNMPNIEVPRLDLTSKQKQLIIYILVLVPGLLVSVGLLIWLKHN
ncbi:MAG: GldG family protein [Candidatus Omnitrophica bacterium]|nr:GldG family protein [Candidatus Omnitrophota bacterium]MCB9720627.1 GldG family protein [Candidatus Omnitrophota bacterium]